MFARRRELLEREADRLGALAVAATSRTRPTSQRLVEQTVERVRRDRHPRQQRRRPAAAAGASTSTDEPLEGAVELLLLSAIRLTRPLPAVPRARAAAAGSINIESSSVQGADRRPRALERGAARASIGWTKTLSREVGPKGITVNYDRARAGSTPSGSRGLPGRADARRPRRRSRSAARRAARDRRRRLLPRLRARLLRHRHGRSPSTAASRASLL